MAYEGPGTILGGLPVIAVVESGKDADTPNGPGDYWSEVQSLHWMKRDGSKGKQLPEHLVEKAEAYDSYFSSLIEQVHDHIAFERWEQELREKIPHHATCSADYPEKPKGEPAQPVVDCGDGIVCCGDCGATYHTKVKLT